MAGTSFDIARLKRACHGCSLQQLCLPAGLDAESAARLDALMQRRQQLSRGESLFRPGDGLDAIYVVREGALKTTVLSPDGQEQVLGFHLPGELAGLDGLADGAHRCEAVALTSTTLCQVPFGELSEVAARLPALQRQLLRIVGQGGRNDQDHLEILIRRQAGERIAMFLHGLRERYQQAGNDADLLQLPMTREDIGRYLGLALETVSRGFARLQDDGVIAVTGRRVEIRDGAKLERLAHGETVPPGAARGVAGKA